MHPEILTPAQIRVLDRLKGISSLPTFYMAGGTALALRHGHRRSVDFDFFRDAELDGEALLRELRAALGEVEQIPTDPSALYVVIEGVTTSFFPYRYLFDRKFGSRQTSRYHRIRALSYFADAEAEPMPEMLVEFEWTECVRFFTAEVTRLLDTLGD
jgi:hypothetical protein